MATLSKNDLDGVMRKLRDSGDMCASSISPADVERVIDAMENPEYRWRTVRGIAADANLDAGTVLEILAALGEWVICSSTQSETGEDLYTTRNHFRKTASLWERVRGVLLNRAN